MENTVTALHLTPIMAKQLIVKIAQNSDNIFFTDHALKRMKKRRISTTQVICCLKHGVVSEGPARDIKGDWKLSVDSVSAGDPLTVVVALKHISKKECVLVITSY